MLNVRLDAGELHLGAVELVLRGGQSVTHLLECCSILPDASRRRRRSARRSSSFCARSCAATDWPNSASCPAISSRRA